MGLDVPLCKMRLGLFSFQYNVQPGVIGLCHLHVLNVQDGGICQHFICTVVPGDLAVAIN